MTKKHDIIWLESTDSTNEEAGRRISDLDNLSVLSALRQTEGRGQRGNSWSSNDGENLTFSIVLKYGNVDGYLPEIRAVDQSAISEAAALAVVDLLASYDIEAKIKWPNDIYVCNRKICGILIENSLRGSYMADSIIGIGLNVNQRIFDPSLPNPTSMVLCTHDKFQKLDPRALLEEFMDIFTGYCNRYMNITGGLARLRKLYLPMLWRLDEPARYIDCSNGHEFEGIIRGLSDIGHLIVEDTEKGELREFAFKEISYII